MSLLWMLQYGDLFPSLVNFIHVFCACELVPSDQSFCSLAKCFLNDDLLFWCWILIKCMHHNFYILSHSVRNGHVCYGTYL